MADSANTKNPSKYNLAVIMRDAHQEARYSKSIWGDKVSYSECFAVALKQAWMKAQMDASFGVSPNAERIASLRNAIMIEESKPFRNQITANVSRYRAEIAQLEAA